jgi:hypothetical protein
LAEGIGAFIVLAVGFGLYKRCSQQRRGTQQVYGGPIVHQQQAVNLVGTQPATAIEMASRQPVSNPIAMAQQGQPMMMPQGQPMMMQQGQAMMMQQGQPMMMQQGQPMMMQPPRM